MIEKTLEKTFFLEQIKPVILSTQRVFAGKVDFFQKRSKFAKKISWTSQILVIIQPHHVRN